MIDYVIDGGVNYIVALGSTGEAMTQTLDEERAVLDSAITHIDGRVPLVAGNFGGNDTMNLCRKLKNYRMDGIDGLLCSNPEYNKPTQAGIIAHYHALADCTDLPMIIYNVPSRTGSNMVAETSLQVGAEIPHVVAVKEASAFMDQIKEIADHKSDDFLLLSGDDMVTHDMMQMGCDGVISVIANIYPRVFSQMITHCQQGKWAEAKVLDDYVRDVHQYLYVEGNPTGVKSGAQILGLCTAETRLPLMPLTTDNYQLLADMIHGKPDII
ncbi:UNVERIFIED_CONTAM: hypothetical protein GTU68_067351 [Idotea baltica]|nr:hypothetical protein [Idotea baltica]